MVDIRFNQKVFRGRAYFADPLVQHELFWGFLDKCAFCEAPHGRRDKEAFGVEIP